MGMDAPKKPGLLQIMRMASSPDFQKSIKATQTQLNHGHAMLAELLPEHEKIHAAAIATITAKQPNARKNMPEMADAAEIGQCMYSMIGFMYVQKFGLPAYQECKLKFPGLEP